MHKYKFTPKANKALRDATKALLLDKIETLTVIGMTKSQARTQVMQEFRVTRAQLIIWGREHEPT